MKTLEIQNEDGWFNPIALYLLVAVFVIVLATLSYQGWQASSKAKEINDSAYKFKQETKESIAVFSKINIIRDNEIKIDEHYQEIDVLKTELNLNATDIKKYGIKSTSKYVVENQ